MGNLMSKVDFFLGEVRPHLGGNNRWELDILTSAGQRLCRIWHGDSGYKFGISASETTGWTEGDAIEFLKVLFTAASRLMAHTMAFIDLEPFIEGAIHWLKVAGQENFANELEIVYKQLSKDWIVAIEILASDNWWAGETSLINRSLSSLELSGATAEERLGVASSFVVIATAMKTLSPQSRDWETIVNELEERMAKE